MYFDEYGNFVTSRFEQSYRCYPAAFIDKPQLETGDKIIMPASALERLSSLQIDYPMMFELHNGNGAAAEGRVSHCGVLEFIAEEGVIYMPYWMMKNLRLQEGDLVQVKNATLPKGKYVKLQPHSKDFLDISNPKAVLETTLRNFSCLTTGDTIMLEYNNKEFYIDIVETKPSNAVSIIETDCEVDFAPPLDYVEPAKKPAPGLSSKKLQAEAEEITPAEVEPRFSAFTGTANRMDGKSLVHQPSSSSCLPVKDNRTVAAAKGNGKDLSESTPQGASSRRAQGKLVFGSNAKPTPKETQKVAAKEIKQEKAAEKKEESKFQAFTGKKYSLMG